MKEVNPNTPGIVMLAGVLAAPARWRLMEELSKGGVFTVTELARAAGVALPSASKHLSLLKDAGIAVSGKGRLYSLAPGVLAEGGGRVLRLGACTLDFSGGVGEGSSIREGSSENPG